MCGKLFVYLLFQLGVLGDAYQLVQRSLAHLRIFHHGAQQLLRLAVHIASLLLCGLPCFGAHGRLRPLRAAVSMRILNQNMHPGLTGRSPGPAVEKVYLLRKQYLYSTRLITVTKFHRINCIFQQKHLAEKFSFLLYLCKIRQCT